jgi:hypothetical protein
MTSDVASVQISTTSLVQGSHAPAAVLVHKSGNTLPQNGKVTAAPPAVQTKVNPEQRQASKPPQPVKPDPPAQAAILNKFLNDSGKPAQFRASSDNKLIEEINPANGQVVAQYPVEEFAELARSVGISGALVDQHA